MDDIFSQLTEGIKYALPAVVTALVSYYFLKRFFIFEEKKQIIQAKKELNKHKLPLRLQAYERLSILLERISPSRLVKNVFPQTSGKKEYLNQLIYQIESEFEHNLSQQIYVSEKCWKIIKTSKNATIFFIRNIAEEEAIKTASDLQRVIIERAVEKEVPVDIALEFLRSEVSEII